MDKTSQLLTVAEVAEWLRVEPRYVYRLASAGELIRVYIGRYVRIPAISVEAYIDAHTVEAVKPPPPLVALAVPPLTLSGGCTIPHSKGLRRPVRSRRRP